MRRHTATPVQISQAAAEFIADVRGVAGKVNVDEPKMMAGFATSVARANLEARLTLLNVSCLVDARRRENFHSERCPRCCWRGACCKGVRPSVTNGRRSKRAVRELRALAKLDDEAPKATR